MPISICAQCSEQDLNNKWLPQSIDFWREIISLKIYNQPMEKSDPNYPILSNLAYNLQYLEYLNQCFQTLYLTSVIRAQNVKTFTITTSQIIECLIHLRLLGFGFSKEEIRESSKALFLAQKNNLFGLGYDFYKNDLRDLRDLRNTIHLQLSDSTNESDYMIFNDINLLNDVKQTLFYFMQKALSLPTEEMKEIFAWLEPLEDFIHSKQP